MKKTYKMTTETCINKKGALAILRHYDIDNAIEVYAQGELTIDPEYPGFKDLVEDLEYVGIALFDLENKQEPEFSGMNYEPESKFSYT